MLAIIGGSGAYHLLEQGKLAGQRLGPLETPFGPSAPLHRLHLGGEWALFMSRHGEQGYEVCASWVNYRANIWALKEAGATCIAAWSGPGAIDESLAPGSFVVPDDLLDETHGRESSFFRGSGLGFVRQSPVFCSTLREAFRQGAAALGLEWRDGGTYACTQGPRLETPAEIRKLRLLGGHLVGMTLAPECFLARELELCYLPVCYVTNLAEGVRPAHYQEGVLFEGLLDPEAAARVEGAVARFPEIMAALASHLEERADCPCRRAMERYRRSGRIGADWHQWVTER